MHMQLPSFFCFLYLCLTTTLVNAELAVERGRVEVLPEEPNPHWVWVTDTAFSAMESSKSYLIDGDTGKFMGLLSIGFSATGLMIPRTYGEIYSPETYMSRGTRGTRTDLIQVYDAITLEAGEEVVIPAKRSENLASLHNQVLTDDDRFALIYNFTPAQSISVVNVKERKFVGEIDTPGCTLMYPTGISRFQMLCVDGALLGIELTEQGTVHKKVLSKPFFDPDKDFIFVRGVRTGNYWLFPSIESNIYPVNVAGPAPEFEEKWPLLTEAQRAEEWRIGGIQAVTVHTRSNRLYTLMHQGNKHTRKHPGTEVWIYDLGSKKQIGRIKLKSIATSILISQDEEPLLFTIFPGKSSLEIYDALKGEHQRSVSELGITLTLLQSAIGG